MASDLRENVYQKRFPRWGKRQRISNETLDSHLFSATRGGWPSKIDAHRNLEDNVLLLCDPYTPNAEEIRAISNRMKARIKQIDRIDATARKLETRLNVLRSRRYNLQITNWLADALVETGKIASESVEDDASVLSTDYVPDYKERVAIQDRLYVRRSHISCLNDVLSDYGIYTTNHIRIRARINALEDTCAVSEALLAPIRKLPAELLGTIFELSIPTLDLDCLPSKPKGGKPGIVRENEPHPHDVRYHLSKTCRRWRRVAHDTPRIWTTVALDYALPMGDVSSILHTLTKSKTCPIDVYLDPFSWFGCTRTDYAPTVLQLLREECSRFRVFVSYGCTQEELLYLFPLGTQTGASSLEICNIEQWDPNKDEIILGPVDAPNLKSLNMVGADHSLRSFTIPSFRSLNQLTILPRAMEFDAPWSTWLETLAQCSHLERLHLTCSTLDEYGSGGRVCLPSLTCLTLTAQDPLAMIHILESLDTPSLKTFKTGGCSRPAPAISAVLESLRTEVSTSLRHLTLYHASFTGDTVPLLLKRHETLETLRLIDCSTDEAFFAALMTPIFDRNSSTCPKLSKLEFIRVSVPGDALIRLIVSRTISDDEDWDPDCFMSISVRNCRRLEGHHIAELIELQDARKIGRTLDFVP